MILKKEIDKSNIYSQVFLTKKCLNIIILILICLEDVLREVKKSKVVPEDFMKDGRRSSASKEIYFLSC